MPNEPHAHLAPERLLSEREWLRRLAVALVGGNDADDLTQETLARALEFEPAAGRDLRPWLASVARNLARRWTRDLQRRSEREASAARSEAQPSVSDIVERVSLQRAVVDAVLALDEPYRTTLLLRYWDGLAPREIAARDELPVETVRTRIKRALERVRVALDRRSGGRTAWLGSLAPFAVGRDIAASAMGPIGGALSMSTAVKVVVAAAAALAIFVLFHSRPTATGSSPDLAHASEATLEGPVSEEQRPPSSRSAAEAAPRVLDASTKRVERQPGFVVSVVDASTGVPVAGAVGTLRVPGLQQPKALAQGVSDSLGVLHVEDPRRGQQRRGFALLLVEDREHAPRSVWRQQEPGPDQWGSDIDLGQVQLERGTRVSGRVVSADGRTPVADAELRVAMSPALAQENTIAGAPAAARSGPDGSFELARRIAPLPYAPTMIFAVAERGVGWSVLGVANGVEDLRDVVVRVRPAADLDVMVRDESGASVPDATITARPRFEPVGESYGSAPSGPLDEALAKLWQAQTDADGLAHLPSLTVDDDPLRVSFGRKYKILVAAARFREQSKTVELDPARSTSLEVVLAPLRRTTLTGTVRSSEGTPIAGATIAVEGQGHAETDAGGVYRLSIVANGPGECALSAAASGYATLRHAIRLDEGIADIQLDLTLELGTKVEGRIVDGEGAPIADASVWIDGEERTGDRSRPEDGSFSLHASTDPPWRIHVSLRSGSEEWDGPFEFAAEPADSPLLLRFCHSEPGRVVLALELVELGTGRALTPCEAHVYRESNLPQAIGFSAPVERRLGGLSASGLKRGRWRAVVRTADGPRVDRVFEVAQDDGDLRLRWELEHPGEIDGVVIWDDVPLELRPKDAFVFMVQPVHEGQWISDDPRSRNVTRGFAQVDASHDWRFRLVDVQAGEAVTLQLGPEPLSARTEVLVPSAGTAKAELRARLGGVLRFEGEGAAKLTIFHVELRADSEPPRELLLLPGGGAPELGRFTLPPGIVKWRATYFGATRASDEPNALSGEATLRAGETTTVLLRL